MTSKYDDDFFESESGDLGDDDFADGLASSTGRSAAPLAAPKAAAKKGRVRIKPMPEALIRLNPDIQSAVHTTTDGKQTIYLRKRGA